MEELKEETKNEESATATDDFCLTTPSEEKTVSHQSFSRNFALGPVLGDRSTWWDVSLCINRDDWEAVALHHWTFIGKNLDKLNEEISTLHQQMSCLVQLSHRNIVSYIAMESSIKEKFIKVWQQFVPGISLQQKITCGERVPMNTLRTYTLQMLQALDYLHSESIVHGKFKASSIFLDSKGEIKVADFYIKKRLDDLNASSRPHNQPNKSNDVLQLACVVLSLAYGKETTILSKDQSMPEFPPVFEEFLKMCFTMPDNPHRNSADLLNHRFLTGRISLESRMSSDFRELDKLGEGAFGKVVKVQHCLDDRKYAIKIISFNVSQTDRITREVKLVSQLNHKNVVRYCNAWIEFGISLSNFSEDLSSDDSSRNITSTSDSWPENKLQFNTNSSDSVVFERQETQPVGDRLSHTSTTSSQTNETEDFAKRNQARFLFIQMECCEKRTLRNEIMSGLDSQHWRMLFRQMVEGLAVIHENKIIHRDLKPENIFIDEDGNVKIGDFGHATSTLKDLSNSSNEADFPSGRSAKTYLRRVKTYTYRAPEVLNSNKKTRHNSKMDIYSLGIIFFEMVYPMEIGMERSKVLEVLRTRAVSFPSAFDEDLLRKEATIIKRCLNHEPSERPDARDLLKLIDEDTVDNESALSSKASPLHYPTAVDDSGFSTPFSEQFKEVKLKSANNEVETTPIVTGPTL